MCLCSWPCVVTPHSDSLAVGALRDRICYLPMRTDCAVTADNFLYNFVLQDSQIWAARRRYNTAATS